MQERCSEFHFQVHFLILELPVTLWTLECQQKPFVIPLCSQYAEAKTCYDLDFLGIIQLWRSVGTYLQVIPPHSANH